MTAFEKRSQILMEEEREGQEGKEKNTKKSTEAHILSLASFWDLYVDPGNLWLPICNFPTGPGPG